jgi:hypothetical protein
LRVFSRQLADDFQTYKTWLAKEEEVDNGDGLIFTVNISKPDLWRGTAHWSKFDPFFL